MPARVLVMDDEDYIRNVAWPRCDALAMKPFWRVTIGRPVALLEHSARAGERIDAAILDMTIPGGPGGVEALKRLRAVVPDLPAVRVERLLGRHGARAPEGHGDDDSLPEPFTLADLDAVLTSVLAKRR